MSKLKKTTIVFFLLLLIYLCFSVVVSYQDYEAMPFYFLRLEEYPLLGDWLPVISLYLSLVSMIVLFILILITIFYPKKISQFVFGKTDGVLRISKKAVEGIVAETLITEKLMKNPNVTVKMSRKKIKVNVKGDVQIVSDLYGKTDEWSKHLENQLHQLIGPEVKISIKVTFEKPQLKNNQRVK